MLNNEFEEIVTKPNLKSELMFIIINFLNNIILGELNLLFDLSYMRNVLIKHYNFEYEFKNNIDTYLKEIINYLIIFMEGNDDENRNKINSYFIPDDFDIMYTLYGYLCYLGLRGIMDKNYNETLNKYNYLLKNDEGSFTDIVYLHHIYMIKIKQRKLDKENNNNSNNNNKNNKTEDKELIELEKKVLNLFYIYQ